MRVRKKTDINLKEMRMVMAANTYTRLKKRGAAEETLKKNFLERSWEKLQKSKTVLLVWGAFYAMLTVSSAVDPLGGEMSRHDRSAPMITGNTFMKE